MTLSPDELVALSVAETIWDPVPVQTCPKCRTLRALDDFEGYKTCGSCRAAARERSRLEYQRIKSDPKRYAKKLAEATAGHARRRERAKVDPSLAQSMREAARRYRERRMGDPERRRQELENRRIRDTIKRREQGAREMPQRSPLGVATKTERKVRLPVGPFREWLGQRLDLDSDGWYERAEAMGMIPRSAARILRESDSYVSLDLVDRVLLHEGSTRLDELYPELYEFDDQAAA